MSQYDRTEMPDPRAYPSFWEDPEESEVFAGETLADLDADAEKVIARYPHRRSALLPLLHLVQSVEGYVSGRGIEWCARKLDLTTAEVSGVATFYTQYKRHPNGDYTIGVCTNTLCAIMGGDRIFDELSAHLGVGHDETTPDGKITLERVECNAACDYAPVVMANWEFFDNQTPETARKLADDLRSGAEVRPTRGADRVCGFKHVSRVLAGFPDGRADEGVGAGGPSVEGLRVAHEHHWTAPGEDDGSDGEQVARDTPADEGTTPQRGRPGSEDTPANPADSKPGDRKGQA